MIETPGFEHGPAGLQVRPAQQFPPQQPGGYQPAPMSQGGAVYPINPQIPPELGRPAAVPPTAPAAAVPSTPTSVADLDLVVLSKRYEAHGDGFQRIRFRRPTADDLMRCGYALKFIYGDDGRLVDVQSIPDAMGKYIVALGTAIKDDGTVTPITTVTVKQFEIWDFESCSEIIGRFFVKRG